MSYGHLCATPSSKKQQQSKKLTRKLRTFGPGDRVMMRDYSYHRTTPWTPACVTRKTGPVSYTVTANDTTYRRHADQLAPTQITAAEPPSLDDARPEAPPAPPSAPADSNGDAAQGPPQPPPPLPQPPQHVRRSTRTKTSVQRYGNAVPWTAINK